MTENDQAKIVDAMVLLLESDAAYSIDLSVSLTVRLLDDLTFAVGHEKYDKKTRTFVFDYEKIFVSAREAVLFFESERRRLQIGDDFETGLLPEIQQEIHE